MRRRTGDFPSARRSFRAAGFTFASGRRDGAASRWCSRTAPPVVVGARSGRLFLRPRRRRRAGSLYRFRLDGEPNLYPDPALALSAGGTAWPLASRRPGRVRLDRPDWRGAGLAGQVIYEMHVGTFTQEGTWEAARANCRNWRTWHHRDRGDAARRLRRPLRLGLRRRQPVRPHAAVRHGPTTCAASSIAPTPLGIGVILDVVYNHLGPDGNYLGAVLHGLLHGSLQERMGRGDQLRWPDAGPVREFFVANAGYWIDEFHLDGLRLDATQHIFDDSARPHSGGHRPRGARGGRRAAATIIVAENEPQQTRARAPRRAGRLRLRRPVERRFPSHAPSSP